MLLNEARLKFTIEFLKAERRRRKFCKQILVREVKKSGKKFGFNLKLEDEIWPPRRTKRLL